MSPDHIKEQFKRAAAVRYAWAFIGLPYLWGGDDPILGFDCSGFVIEALKSVGALPHSFDTTAQGLMERFSGQAVATGYAGCIVCWLNAGGKATHVEMMVDDYHTLGASGGGSATTSPDAAAAQNAFIKQRPVGYRGQGYRTFDPFLKGAQ